MAQSAVRFRFFKHFLKFFLFFFPAICQRILEFKEIYAKEFMVGVYISPAYEDDPVFLKKYLAIIESYLTSKEKYKIFVSTSSPAILRTFQDRYSEIIFNHKRLSKNKEWKEFVIDAYLLLGCQRFFFAARSFPVSFAFKHLRKFNYYPFTIDADQFQPSIIPKIPMKLPGSLWGISVLFNPAGYKNKIENYRIFRERGKKQGLKLLAVELAFGEQPFELTESDAEILIQLRGDKNNIMWQKERLLNIGLKKLPIDCDKVAWLDADILFENDDWVRETSKLLEEYVIIQPFEAVAGLSKNSHTFEVDPKTLPFGIQVNDGQRFYGMAYGVNKFGRTALKNYYLHGHPGLVWASRRTLLEKHGFYDKNVLASGDWMMAFAFYGAYQKFENLYPSKLFSIYAEWASGLSDDVRGSIYKAPGFLAHLWHGSCKDRLYSERLNFIKSCDFDPQNDIRLDKNNCWAWATDKYKMHQWIREYFLRRNEE